MASAASNGIRKLTQAALARELGVSRQAIHDLVERGVLQKGADGLIDVELAKVAIANRVRPSGKTAENLQAPPAPPAVAAAAPAAPALATDYHTAKTLREAAEAAIAKLKLEEMQGKLTDAEEVGRAVWTAFRYLRDAAMPLGRRVAGRVAGMSDVREIQLLVDAEMRLVLNGFRDKVLAELANRHGAGAEPAAEEGAPADADR